MSNTEALRAALAQALAALATCNSNEGDDPWFDHEKVYAAREAVRAALAQPAASGEPADMRDAFEHWTATQCSDCTNYTIWKAACAWMAAQPAPALVPLTDAQIFAAAEKIDNGAGFLAGFYQGAKSAERAHGIAAPNAPQSHPQR